VSLDLSVNAGPTKNSHLPSVLMVAKNAQQVTIAPVAVLLQRRRLALLALTALQQQQRNYPTAIPAPMAVPQIL
jgi:hypothetical protein